MRVTLILIIILAMPCSVAFSQEKPTRISSIHGDAEYNIDLRVPPRLIKLSSTETTVKYLDRKSNATMVINRNRFSEFSGQNSAEAALLYLDKLGDPNCFEVSQGKFSLKIGSCELVNWKTKQQIDNRNNNQNSMAMLEVGGTTYDFHISHPSINEKEMNSLFKRILKSIKRTNT